MRDAQLIKRAPAATCLASSRHGRPWPHLLRALAALAAASALGCAQTPTPPPANCVPGACLPPGDHYIQLELGGTIRSYRAHVPPGPRPESGWPLVLNFHGGGGNAREYQIYVRMDPVADARGFVVVYPNGNGRLRETLLTWNAGTCCGYALERNADDVGFTRAVVSDLALRLAIDRSRVYATGLSNGAMMAYRLAVEAPDLVVAIAPIAGAMAVAKFAPSRPMPIMHVHSVDDPRAPYRGGLGPPSPFTGERIEHNGVEATLREWVEFSACSPTPVDEEKIYGRPDTRSASHSATKLAWKPCLKKVEIVLWRLTGAGHVWPGGAPDYLSTSLGQSTDIIDANRQAWEFFSRFRHPRAGADRTT